ncbi:MAG: lysylphosphatidylglycerol synthase transmembrane domain-containing protein [Acidimicrobiales bacterium]
MSRRKRIFFILRIVASAVMLAVLLPRVHLSSLIPRSSTALAWLAAGVLTWMAAVLLATLRWQRVLVAIELPEDLPPLLSHSMAALFVSNFLPSTIGGDVLRVTRLSAGNGNMPGSFASVVIERLTGFVVLPMITLAALVSEPALLRLGTASRISLLLSAGTLLALAGILVLASNPRGKRLAENENWLRFAGAVHLGIEQLRRQPSAALAIIGTAIAYQMTIVLAAWMAAHALNIHLGWAAAMAFIPVVAMAQVLPVSVMGLGLREGALVLLLTPLGVPAGQAVALGLLLYGMNLTVSLIGAPAFAVGTRPVRATA